MDKQLLPTLQITTQIIRNNWILQEGGAKDTVTRDSVTLLLDGKSLPKGDFIELYDSTPYKIVNGHFVAKIPCTTKSQSEVDLLTGEAPNFKSSNAELVSELSTPGKLCVYHVDLLSGSNNILPMLQ